MARPLDPVVSPGAGGRCAGFTVLELVLVVAIVGIALLAVQAGPPPNAYRRVQASAREVAASIENALANAEARQGDAVLYADVSVLDDQRGRFRAIYGEEDVDSVGMGELGWIALFDGPQWGVGMATVGPLDDSLADRRIPAEVRCRMRACELGDSVIVVYYLTHAKEPRAVGAVTLTEQGVVQTYTWEPATAAWHMEAR